MRAIICRLFVPFIFLIAIVANPPTLRAETIDQANTPAWTGGAANIVPANKVSQTVKPSLPLLTAVEVALKTGNRGRGGDKVTLTILDAAGKPLASTEPASINEGFEGFHRFTMPGNGINVTPNQTFTLRIEGTNRNVFWWKYVGGNSYAAGQGWFFGSPFQNNDFMFRTYGANPSSCPTGQTNCNGVCKNLQTDTGNCGTCGRTCGSGQTCTQGSCKSTCPTGQASCNGTCKNLVTDASNCGACGRACGTGQTCYNAICTCPKGLIVCGNTCFNPQTQKCVNNSVPCPLGAWNACGAICFDPWKSSCIGGKVIPKR